MEKECISDHKELKKKENGVKERESNGNKKIMFQKINQFFKKTLDNFWLIFWVFLNDFRIKKSDEGKEE